jgi:hypothetical protein
MKAVWKFPISGYGDQRRFCVGLPRGACIVEIAVQDDKECIWAIVDPRAPMVTHEFLFVSTGDPIPEGLMLCYLKTLFRDDGAFVRHLFRVIPDEEISLGRSAFPPDVHHKFGIWFGT